MQMQRENIIGYSFAIFHKGVAFATLEAESIRFCGSSLVIEFCGEGNYCAFIDERESFILYTTKAGLSVKKNVQVIANDLKSQYIKELKKILF